jgi:hypothetical protein
MSGYIRGMSLRQKRRRKRDRDFCRPVSLISLGERVTRVSPKPVTRVRYSLAMPGGRIDREAWARELAELIGRFDPGARWPGNKSAFSRRIEFTTRTIDRWLAQQTDVEPDSVRAVGDRLGMSEQQQVEMLTRIGYFTNAAVIPDGIRIEEPEVPDPYKDRVVRRILDDPTLTEEQRAALVQLQLDRMDADFKRRLEEYERLRQAFGGHSEAS